MTAVDNHGLGLNKGMRCGETKHGHWDQQKQAWADGTARHPTPRLPAFVGAGTQFSSADQKAQRLHQMQTAHEAVGGRPTQKVALQTDDNSTRCRGVPAPFLIETHPFKPYL